MRAISDASTFFLSVRFGRTSVSALKNAGSFDDVALCLLGFFAFTAASTFAAGPFGFFATIAGRTATASSGAPWKYGSAAPAMFGSSRCSAKKRATSLRSTHARKPEKKRLPLALYAFSTHAWTRS